MIKTDLIKLGDKIAQLRIAKDLKQSELAYEAGISERTLQRIEAGEVVKSDGLLKVIAYLGRLDELISALDTPTLSPLKLINQQKSKNTSGKKRVRRSANEENSSEKTAAAPKTIVWPEDQP